MKNIFLIGVLLLFPLYVYGQRLAYIDKDYILSQIPEYNSALQEIDKQSYQWQLDIDDAFLKIKEMKEKFLIEKLIMPESERQKTLQEIEKKEGLLIQLQQIRFGAKGELYKMRIKLLKPIQDMVAKAIQEVATNERYDIIIDKGEGSNLLYVNNRYDLSNVVLNKLGYKVSE